MSTECNQFVFGFHPLKHREIRAQFDGGAITTEGGGLLLREVEKRIGIVRQFAACFRDYRNPDLIEHTVEELVLIDGFGGGEASGRGSLSSGMVAFPPFRPGFHQQCDVHADPTRGHLAPRMRRASSHLVESQTIPVQHSGEVVHGCVPVVLVEIQPVDYCYSLGNCFDFRWCANSLWYAKIPSGSHLT